MPDFPAHASPAFLPLAAPRPQAQRNVSQLDLNHSQNARRKHSGAESTTPPPVVTPPKTPDASASGQPHDRLPKSVPVASPTASESQPRLLPKLPQVWCEVRARIPTTTGQEMWLNLYHNDADSKEHLAIVFGPHIRSRSLDALREGETERDRMIRGAYVGTLFPGRTSSRIQQIRQEEGVSSSGRPSAGYLSQLNGGGGGGGQAPLSPASQPSEYDSETDYPPEYGPPMVRIHSECYTGETVWSARCDCGEQLDEAARLMSLPAPTPSSTQPSTPGSEAGEHLHRTFPPTEKLPSCGGVIVYLRQEGRGIGLKEKLKAYNLQDLGHDTMEANLLLRHPGDARSYGLATAILLDLGLGGERGIKLLTNNPEKVRAVEGPNREVRVVERMPMVPLAWQTHGEKGVHGPEVEKYLATKIEKFKHEIGLG